MNDPNAVSDKERNVDAVVAAASQAAANWIHSPQAVGALAIATGLSPLAIHIGFMFASLFHHHAQAIGANVNVPSPVAVAQATPQATPDAAAAAAAAAKQQAIDDLKAKLQALENQ